jgi:hypothetical protein
MTRFTLIPTSLIAALTLTSAAVAQQRPVNEYATKFLCGVPQPPDTATLPVAPGRYFTAINVHNPTDATVRFRRKFAVALPLEAGPIRGFFYAELGADQALEIDCEDILNAFPPRLIPLPFPPTRRARFLKGFAIIQPIDSAVELDIVAVYTAAGATGRVETLEIERVPARRVFVAVLLDLVPDSPCKRDSLGLHVTVRNQGNGDAPASTTTVDFLTIGSVAIPTPPIPAGGSVTLPPVTIPPGCFNPDCEFQIMVDSAALIAESNEGNNTVASACIG